MPQYFDESELDGLGDLGFSFNVKSFVKKATKVVRKAHSPIVKLAKRTTPGGKAIDRLLVKADRKITRPIIRQHNAIADRALVALDKNVTRKLAKPLKPFAQKVEKGVVKNLDAIAIVASVIPGVQAAAPFIRAAAVSRKVAVAHKNAQAAARAMAEHEKRKLSMIADIKGAGFSHAQAGQIVARISKGINVQDAIKLAGKPVGVSTVQKQLKNFTERKASDPKAEFLNWLKGWRPDVHAKIMQKVATASLSGIPGNMIDHDSGEWETQHMGGVGDGLGDWTDTIGDWAGAAWDAAKSVISSPAGQAVLQNQLKRAIGGYAPAPTAVATQEAAQGAAPTVGAPVPGVAPVNARGGGGSMMLPLVGVGALAFLALR